MINEKKELMIVRDNLDLTTREIRILCNDLMKSKFKGKFTCVEDAIIAAQCGKELGLPPTVAWREIHVIKGNPGLSAKAQLALIRRQVPSFQMKIEKNDSKVAQIKVWENYDKYPELGNTFKYTMEDAKIAGDANKENYKKHPRQMLWARCISEMARNMFSHITCGLYTPEELEYFEDPKELTPIQEKKLKESIINIEEKLDSNIIEVITDEDIKKTNDSLKSDTKKDFESMQKALKLAKSKGMKLSTKEWRKDYWNEGMTWEPEEDETDWDKIQEVKGKELDKLIKETSKKFSNPDEKALKQLQNDEEKEYRIDLGRDVKKTSKKKKDSKKTSKPKKKQKFSDDEIKELYRKSSDKTRNTYNEEEFIKFFKRNLDGGK